MKIISILFAAALTFQTSIIIAGNDIRTADNSVNNSSIIQLAPATPAEATFEEVVTIDLHSLIPSTPPEADFEDTVTGQVSDPQQLAPVTPVEADFE